ncbi:hypothetical protein GQ53DRAFT_887984 [Thozetella sp. PMI_491]|nr:hypothetical protein GQ53DRAFT_887984 [Thozetella sp. PMI_491]
MHRENEDDIEEERPFIDEQIESCPPSPLPRGFARAQGRARVMRSSLCQVVILVLSHLFLALLGAIWAWNTINLDANCAAYTTQYSPILDEVNIKYEWWHFNGSFMQETVYRRKGDPEVDAAWEALGLDSRPGIISFENGLEAGLTPSHVQRSEKYGGGFFVNVEGMHHLHCLNLVRKSLYYNYDYYKKLGTHAFKNDDQVLQLHVSHCLDIIRQVLMCNTDTGVLGQVWTDPEKPSAFPDFQTQHRCKNFDDVRAWAVAHQEPPPDSLPPDYMKWPDKSEVLPYTP